MLNVIDLYTLYVELFVRFARQTQSEITGLESV